MTAIQIINLEKKYGEKTAVQPLNLPSGRVNFSVFSA